MKHPCIRENTIMTVNEYQAQALRTVKQDMSREFLLEEGIMGLCGEAGEAIDILKNGVVPCKCSRKIPKNLLN